MRRREIRRSFRAAPALLAAARRDARVAQPIDAVIRASLAQRTMDTPLRPPAELATDAAPRPMVVRCCNARTLRLS